MKALPSIEFASIDMEGMPVEMKLHWSVTDKSGDRLVIEMDEDGINTYRGEDAMVMTNDPSMKIQLEQLKEVEPHFKDATRDTDYGSIGNGNSHSRFLHANYFMSHLEQPTSITNGMMKLSTVPSESQLMRHTKTLVTVCQGTQRNTPSRRVLKQVTRYSSTTSMKTGIRFNLTFTT